jgi:hypothetical protein
MNKKENNDPRPTIKEVVGIIFVGPYAASHGCIGREMVCPPYPETKKEITKIHTRKKGKRQDE